MFIASDMATSQPTPPTKYRHWTVSCSVHDNRPTLTNIMERQMIIIVASPTNTLLKQFGLAISITGEVVLRDLESASSRYIHHTFEPVAALGWCAVSPKFARLRLPEYELGDVITKRPNFDDRTATALAAVCGASISGPFGNRAVQFDEYLRPFLERHRMLGTYFGIDSEPHHYAVRPAGVNWRTEEDDPFELRRWRREYLLEPKHRQMLIATVLWLYRGEGEKDSIWLRDLPCSWHIADAYVTLRDAGVLAEWGELVGRYPGW